MIKSFLICALAVGTITAAPQFVTFKDGKIGVNFGGYTAEAGLGGLLTGNAAHGGLSASAGTPFGQRAAAGIGGLVNGEAAGRAYAGAQATDSIGASAILGGSTGPQQHGLLGAEAHSNGNSITKTISSDANVDTKIQTNSPELVVPTDLPANSGVQKIKPPKKYTNVEKTVEFGQQTFELRNDAVVPNIIVTPIIKSHHHQHHHSLRRYQNIRPASRRHIHKHILYTPLSNQRFNDEEGPIKTVKTTYRNVNKGASTTLLDTSETVPGNQNGYQTAQKDVQLNPGALNQFFNIPIGILQSIRDNLQPIGVRKQVSYTSAI